MFKLAIEVCFENHFGLIHAICLSLGSTKSGYFFLGHPVVVSMKCTWFFEYSILVFEYSKDLEQVYLHFDALRKCDNLGPIFMGCYYRLLSISFVNFGLGMLLI